MPFLKKHIILIILSIPAFQISIMSKRKADELSSVVDIDITSLPDGVLSHISGYLEHSSRPLFAVAMTAPPSSFRLYKCNVLPQSSMREAILFPRNRKEDEMDWTGRLGLRDSKVNWNEIDFGGMHMICSGGLTDDTLHAVLVCVGISRIKAIALTRCSKITGIGLEPLRGSKALERIDLSGIMTYSCKKTIFTAFPTEQLVMSSTIVIRILDSIVDETENSLRFIQFPKHWRVEGGDDAFHGFLTKFNDNIRGKSVCARGNCNNACGGSMHTSSGDRYGIQSNTCANSHCGASFCGCPKEDRFDEEQPLEFCHKCKKYYCNNCDAGLFFSREYLCGCNKPTSCDSCTDSAFCDDCGDGPLCRDCYLECKCGQRYCRMEEACK